jgi:hypothetical protein
MSSVVFLGPTISQSEAREHIDATFLPPVSQGDILKCLSAHSPRSIGIIDGYFQNVPSVWHKEILWAMAQGVHVFGASSMGALRAAELHSFGMKGVGQIFECYRSGVYSRDDEVAIIHAPPEVGYAALSEPLASIRVTFAKARAQGVIDAATCDAMIAAAQAMYFPDRHYDAILEAVNAPEKAVSDLRGWLKENKVDQKRLDAIAMLAEMKTFMDSDPAPMSVPYHVENTFVFDRMEPRRSG